MQVAGRKEIVAGSGAHDEEKLPPGVLLGNGLWEMEFDLDGISSDSYGGLMVAGGAWRRPLG